MKRFALLIATLFIFTIAAQAQTQDRATTNGPVWRIVRMTNHQRFTRTSSVKTCNTRMGPNGHRSARSN